jgi:hypothetical protein
MKADFVDTLPLLLYLPITKLYKKEVKLHKGLYARMS